MRLTLNWLLEHLETESSADEVAAALTDLGLEVEEISDPAQAFASFVVARVISAESHPNADRLTVCQVDTGNGKAQVICGAPNARTGLIGVFAPAGVRIPGTGLDLRAAKIRGVESRGMLLSERELGISDVHEGIIELESGARIGESYASHAGLDDPVFTVGVTPNRPDALGVRGIARDLAARKVGALRPQSIDRIPGSYKSPIAVSLDSAVADRACPIFVGRHLRGLKNSPSPEWMQRRLRAVGLRPISALVDITNYMTHDLCRPLHVFDADRITGDILVRFAKPGETMKALDGKEYPLGEGMTVIGDASGPQGLGGVIGGEWTGCTEGTASIVLESAYFDPVRTATTGRLLGISSDARFRFERGIDPAFTPFGIEIATRMILEFCGGEASDVIVAGAVPDTARAIDYRPARLKALLAMDLPGREQRRILTALGFKVEVAGEVLRVAVPSWRPDVEGEADLVEEVARIASLSRIEATPLPRRRSGVAVPALDRMQRRVALARRALAARGLNECVCYSFVSAEDAERFGCKYSELQLDNPISNDLAVMRPSLLPALLRAAARNRARGYRDLGLFEVGPEFYGGAPGAQQNMAAALRMGDASRRAWNEHCRPADVFDVKADALALVSALGGPVNRLDAHAEAPAWYHPGRSGTLGFVRGKPLAVFGELHPRLVEEFELEEPVAAFELNIENLPFPKRGRGARPPLEIANFQAVDRDFAFTLDEQVQAKDLVRAARGAERELIESVHVFDVFEGSQAEEHFGPGKKSIAISVRLQPRNETLSESAIERVGKKIISRVEEATGGVLRT